MKDKRKKFIIDEDDDEENDEWVADKIRVALNLAFIPEKYAKDFTFSKKSL